MRKMTKARFDDPELEWLCNEIRKRVRLKYEDLGVSSLRDEPS